MKLTRQDVYSFFNVVGGAQFDMPIKTAFRYMLSKNLKKAKSEIDDTDALFPAPAGYDDYFKSRVDIFTKMNIGIAPNGSADVEAINALSPEDKAVLNDDLTKLISSNKEVLEQIKILNDEKLNFLSETIDIDFETVKIDDVPNIAESNGDQHWEIWRLLELVVVK